MPSTIYTQILFRPCPELACNFLCACTSKQDKCLRPGIARLTFLTHGLTQSHWLWPLANEATKLSIRRSTPMHEATHAVLVSANLRLITILSQKIPATTATIGIAGKWFNSPSIPSLLYVPNLFGRCSLSGVQCTEMASHVLHKLRKIPGFLQLLIFTLQPFHWRIATCHCKEAVMGMHGIVTAMS